MACSRPEVMNGSRIGPFRMYVAKCSNGFLVQGMVGDMLAIDVSTGLINDRALASVVLKEAKRKLAAWDAKVDEDYAQLTQGWTDYENDKVPLPKRNL